MRIGLDSFNKLLNEQGEIVKDYVYFTRMRKPWVPGAAVVVRFQDSPLKPGVQLPRVSMVDRPGEEYIVMYPNQISFHSGSQPRKRAPRAKKAAAPKKLYARSAG
jgi:hypothetical protein